MAGWESIGGCGTRNSSKFPFPNLSSLSSVVVVVDGGVPSEAFLLLMEWACDFESTALVIKCNQGTGVCWGGCNWLRSSRIME